jgi:hypothetical protein
MKNYRLTFPAGKSGHIAVYDDLIPADVCVQLVRECEINTDRFHEGVTLGGPISHIKCSLDLPLDPDGCGFEWWEGSAAMLHGRIMQSVVPAFNHYLETYVDLHIPFLFGDTGYRVQKYAKGQGFYRRHVDATPWDPSSRNRLLAMVMYLNTVQHGGETWFPDRDVKVEAVQGRVAMFPAGWTFPHQGMLPLSGDKWIISTFIVPQSLDEAHEHQHQEHSNHEYHPEETLIESQPILPGTPPRVGMAEEIIPAMPVVPFDQFDMSPDFTK